MEITVNGKKRPFTAPLDVGGLLRALGVNPRAVVVERNLKVLNRDDMEGIPVLDGDTIEIIRLVGGG